MSTSTAQLVAELKALQEKTTFKNTIGGITESLASSGAAPKDYDADPGAHKLQDKPVV